MPLSSSSESTDSIGAGPSLAEFRTRRGCPMYVLGIGHLILAVICGLIADHKGRNVIGWFFFGLFGGLIGLIFVCESSNLKDEPDWFGKMRCEPKHVLDEKDDWAPPGEQLIAWREVLEMDAKVALDWISAQPVADLVKMIWGHSFAIVKKLDAMGITCTFDASGLHSIERYMRLSMAKPGEAKDGSLLADCLGDTLIAVGCLVGEILRQQCGGSWLVPARHTETREAIDQTTLRLGDGTDCWPIQRVIKRFSVGEEADLTAYGFEMGVGI